ncbi:MAG: 30S ribosomal protein S8 [Cyanobacteria bacterium]|nr:30S ribosomal protein S8 [Cyanobacteriota bacterium]MDA1020948.1 30S ribosomal protein S8 [Cyanobacteriota bacterium]
MTTTTTIEEKKKVKTTGTTNDPIADFLTRIRNTLMVQKRTVKVAYSKFKLELANLLVKEGYLESVGIVDDENIATKSIELTLRYVDGKAAIQGLKKYSKPGLRKYTKAQYAPRVLNGLGVSILTTSKGLKTDRTARKEKIGGEILCQVW